MAHARILFIAAALFAAGCGERKAETAPSQPLPSQPGRVGATYSYIRSNQDGSKPEHILVHIVSNHEVHVAKMVEPCTDAAYVTAEFDAMSGEATKLVGGRLTREGTQLAQAFLSFDPATRRMEVRYGDDASAPAETLDAPPAPWRMYDFDLAEFALFGRRKSEDFQFGLVMAWPDGPPPMVKMLGEVNATYVDSDREPDGIKTTNRYTLEGPALPGGGELILDARYGNVIEARIARPNHSGYTDFLLKLDSAALENGEKVWRDALAAHWKGCPA